MKGLDKSFLIKGFGAFLLLTGLIVIYRLFSKDWGSSNNWNQILLLFLKGSLWIAMGLYLLITKIKTLKGILYSNLLLSLLFTKGIVHILEDYYKFGVSKKFYWSLLSIFLAVSLIIFSRLELKKKENKDS